LHSELEADLTWERTHIIAKGNMLLEAEKVALAEASARELASIWHQSRIAQDKAKEEEAQLGLKAVCCSSCLAAALLAPSSSSNKANKVKAGKKQKVSLALNSKVGCSSVAEDTNTGSIYTPSPTSSTTPRALSFLTET
jgi:hypothetical protein